MNANEALTFYESIADNDPRTICDRMAAYLRGQVTEGTPGRPKPTPSQLAAAAAKAYFDAASRVAALPGATRADQLAAEEAGRIATAAEEKAAAERVVPSQQTADAARKRADATKAASEAAAKAAAAPGASPSLKAAAEAASKAAAEAETEAAAAKSAAAKAESDRLAAERATVRPLTAAESAAKAAADKAAADKAAADRAATLNPKKP